MQLKNKFAAPGLGASLAAAACTLLGNAPAQAADINEKLADKDWVVDSALLYYGEDQGRVKDVSARANVSHPLSEDRKLDVGITVDALTGASPSGAVKSDSVQTFTRPSGQGQYQIAAGAQPLDDTFKDTRFAGTGSYTTNMGAASRLQLGLDASAEHDYFHAGINGRWETDFNQKNTTLFAGAAFGSDSINPVGDVPVAFSPMRPAGVTPNRSGSKETKTVVDALLGVSQIINRRSLVDVVLSFSNASGYLNDPYKVLSIVDPITGRPVASPTDPSMSWYVYEKRPDKRTREGLFAEYRYAFDRDSTTLSYRFMNDDWGIRSHTVEAKYHWNFSKHSSLEPQFRYYTQTAADFYKTLLINNQPLPAFASADYRLAKMSSWTVGAKYTWASDSGREYSVRGAYYRQSSDASSSSSIGVLNSFSELVPAVKAVIVQFGVKFGL